jgi:hypothetical protein
MLCKTENYQQNALEVLQITELTKFGYDQRNDDVKP